MWLQGDGAGAGDLVAGWVRGACEDARERDEGFVLVAWVDGEAGLEAGERRNLGLVVMDMDLQMQRGGGSGCEARQGGPVHEVRLCSCPVQDK